jgi:hypothetical protein
MLKCVERITDDTMYAAKNHELTKTLQGSGRSSLA